MRRRATGIFAIMVSVLLAGCHGPPFPMSRSAGNAGCSDPCAAMICPSGHRCVWDTNCQAHCEPPPLPEISR
jgi:hypothetical protein